MANVARIIKDYPRGTLFYTNIWGVCSLSEVTDSGIYLWPMNLDADEHTDDNLCILDETGGYDVTGACCIWKIEEDGSYTQPWNTIEKKIANRKVWIRGNSKYPNAVKDAFEKLGIKNVYYDDARLFGDDNKIIYAIPNHDPLYKNVSWVVEFFELGDKISDNSDSQNNILAELITETYIELKFNTPVLPEGTIVYVSDAIENGFRVARYIGYKMAKLICSPETHVKWKHIFKADDFEKFLDGNTVTNYGNI